MNVRVVVGFLILNIAGLAGLFVLGLQQDCFGTGGVVGGQSFETNSCTSTHWPLALIIGSVGIALGGYFVYDGLRRQPSAALDGAPLPS